LHLTGKPGDLKVPPIDPECKATSAAPDTDGGNREKAVQEQSKGCARAIRTINLCKFRYLGNNM
jgi:hypothetical protein